MKANQMELIAQDAPQALPVAPTGSDTMSMIERLARDPAFDADKLERLLAMKERQDAQQAEQAFNEAMIRFQANPPKILRTKKGHTSSYAPINEVLNAVHPVLTALDFTVRWQFTIHDNGDNVCRCILTHKDGHSQHSDFFAVKDTSGAKSGPQAIQSGRTYAKRYTLFDVLGLEQDNDDDGRVGAAVDDAQQSKLLDLFDNLPEARQASFKAWLLTKGCSDLAALPASKFAEVYAMLSKAAGGAR